MLIEVGKAYLTRGGLKVVIQEQNRGCLYSFVGLLDGTTQTWNESGRFTLAEPSHARDLIAEWVEPQLKIDAGKFYQYRNGKKGFVYWMNPCGDILSVEVSESGDAEWEAWCHHGASGSVHGFNNHDYDIIGPWIDPPKPLELWGNVYKKQSDAAVVYGLYFTKQEAKQAAHGPNVLRTSKFVEVIE